MKWKGVDIRSGGLQTVDFHTLKQHGTIDDFYTVVNEIVTQATAAC